VLRDVGQHGDTVRQHLEEPSTDEEELLGSSNHLLDSQRPGLEDGHERRVPCEDAQLPVRAVGDDELDVALEKASLDAHHPQRKFHCDVELFFISSPCARASSIVPTM
jgi:hypothetical protein